MEIVPAVLSAVSSVLGERRGPMALHEPEFGGNESRYVQDCIASGWVSSVGAYVDRFEAMLSEITGASRAVAVVNGTAALHVSLLLAGVRAGDEVLVPSLTFVATANAISYIGAMPHFVDSEDRRLGVDLDKLAAHLDAVAEIRDEVCVNKATGAVIRAFMPMHVFGHPIDLDQAVGLCKRWNLVLVEDAAESLGSSYKGQHTGTIGRVAGISFNGNKVVTTGGGGAIITNDAELGRRAKHLTTTARVPHRWSFIHDEVGFNYRLPNLNAALGCAQLERLPDFLARKRRLADAYISAFEMVSGASIVAEPPGTRSNYWLMTMLLDRADMLVRDRLLTDLNAAGYAARPIWTPLHTLPMYSTCPRSDLSAVIDLEQRIINLPSSPKLSHAL